MMSKDGIIFAGSGEFGMPSLRALAKEVKIPLVITQPDRPAGRGRALTPTPIAQVATELSLPVLKTADINSESLPPADLLVVIAFGQKIAPHIVDHPRFGSINLHASRLPKYRGAAPINWAIINGETVTGNSVIRLAQKMDAGMILGQSGVEIRELETAGELHDRLAENGSYMIECLTAELCSGIVYQQTPQDESQATYAPKMSRESSKMDWTRPAPAIANQIRGMYPWPGCRVRVIDSRGKEAGRVTLVRARPAADAVDPGQIGSQGLVGAGTASIQIVDLQPEGKRPMPLEAYRNGHAWDAGMRLESIV